MSDLLDAGPSLGRTAVDTATRPRSATCAALHSLAAGSPAAVSTVARSNCDEPALPRHVALHTNPYALRHGTRLRPTGASRRRRRDRAHPARDLAGRLPADAAPARARRARRGLDDPQVAGRDRRRRRSPRHRVLVAVEQARVAQRRTSLSIPGGLRRLRSGGRGGAGPGRGSHRRCGDGRGGGHRSAGRAPLGPARPRQPAAGGQRRPVARRTASRQRVAWAFEADAATRRFSPRRLGPGRGQPGPWTSTTCSSPSSGCTRHSDRRGSRYRDVTCCARIGP